jgi:hypothetical protein
MSRERSLMSSKVARTSPQLPRTRPRARQTRREARLLPSQVAPRAPRRAGRRPEIRSISRQAARRRRELEVLPRKAARTLRQRPRIPREAPRTPREARQSRCEVCGRDLSTGSRDVMVRERRARTCVHHVSDCERDHTEDTPDTRSRSLKYQCGKAHRDADATR